MKVLLTCADDSSGHYRIRLPAGAVDDPTVDVEVVPEKVGLPLVMNTATGRFVGVDLDCDVLVLQRPMMWMMPQLIDFAQERDIAVVVEVDDDFHTAHPSNRAFQLNHPSRNREQNWHYLTECVRKADLVTVSTAQLARRYGSHGRVVVLRNYADPAQLEIKRRNVGTTVGWAGTLVNHPTDLTAARGGVGMALRSHPGWHFLCVGGAGYAADIIKQLEIADPAQFATTAWKPLELHHLVVSTLDAGIVPLTDTAFNAAKSWLKGLEYAAMGIPFVASHLPEYELLRDRGIGILAHSKAKSWNRALSGLMDNPERDALGREYRTIVANDLTIRSHAWRWPEAWRSAWLRRRTQRAIHHKENHVRQTP